ncbi:hypothetical protein BN128_2669 [Cronobacter sakazakii 696]|nr:hypothetical protein BN128_2669 [Cronobacter sakazakii 696]
MPFSIRAATATCQQFFTGVYIEKVQELIGIGDNIGKLR